LLQYWKRGSTSGALDTALATFQSRDSKEDLKYSVKVTEIAKIKEVHIDIGKPIEKAEVVADLYKSETPSCEV
jgi:RNA polymerase-interacting CarD/CdnL/TRCF family regulator